MKQISILFLLALAASLAFYSCGGGKADQAEQAAEEAQEEAEKSVEQAMQEMQQALKGDGEAAEVIDFRQLKELLPEKLAGMERTEHTGEKVGMMGINMSTARATYRQGDQSLEASIIDFAGVGMALVGVAAWANMEFDRETDQGYERTGKIDGYKSFERYDSADKSGETSVLVADRFILAVSGTKVEARELEKAIQELNPKKLARLK
jgi:hypothetical protein